MKKTMVVVYLHYGTAPPPTRRGTTQVTRSSAAQRGRSVPPQELLRRGLQQRVVRAAEHRLGPAQRVDLAGARLFPRVEELQQPVALGVEGADELHEGPQLLGL